MKFSYNWLSELTEGLNIDPHQLGLSITLHTAEQEGVEPVGTHLSQVCAAKVISAEPIPGSKNAKAIVDTVRYGTKTVVCGAPNCRAGIITAYVPLGTRTVSGIESEGMLASSAELGLNRDNVGIMELDANPGDSIAGCIPDHIIEIDNKSLTHRPDLWGHHGMAREVAAILGLKLKDPVDLALLPNGAAPVEVQIEDHTLCPRYSALVFENVTVQPSPLWLQYRLEAVGLNPINNIVDVTNYVLAELPQPMHAFDLDTLSGSTIQVRKSKSGETMVGLNQETYTLDDQSLVIADANGPIAVAGIIGGLATGVTAKTTRIVLESANFHAGSVRKTSSRMKLRTDASMRFEKSQDPHNTLRGLARALALLQIVSPGIRLVGGVVDNSGPLKQAAPIMLPLTWLRDKLGRNVEGTEVRAILNALEFGVEETSPEVYSVKVPTWRATKDIALKEDLVEEIGRMIGYDNIIPTSPLLPVAPPPPNPQRDYLHHLRQACAAQGFTEVSNYSFVNEAQLTELGISASANLRVLNPISADQGLLRNSLLPGLVKNIRDNLRHLDSFRLFEIGHEIHPKPGTLPEEIAHLGAVVCNRDGNGEAGLMEAKRLAEYLLPGAVTKPAEPNSTDHPMRAWDIVWQGVTVGKLSELHPNLVEGRAAVLDLNLNTTQSQPAQPVRYKALPRFPASSFDLTVITPLRTLSGDIAAIIGEAIPNFETTVTYIGEYVTEQKSLSFHVTLQADHTMSQEEIATVRQTMIDRVRKHGYSLTV